MSRSSKLLDPFFSMIAFSVYMGIMGGILLIVPRLVLPQFGVREEINSFSYMLGFVLLCSTFYYTASALAKNRHFANLTVYTRLASPIVTAVLYLMGNAPMNFVALGIVDGLGGVWTLVALRKSAT